MGLYTPEPDLCGHFSPQHNAWTNGDPSWSGFLALPLPAAQSSAFLPLSGAAAPVQSGAAHPPVPASRPPVPVPPRTALYYATVVGAAGAASALQAGMPATLQDVVQLLLEIRAKVRDLSVRGHCLGATAGRSEPSAPASAHPSLASAPTCPQEPAPECAGQPPALTSVCCGPACPSPQPQPVSVPVRPSPQSAPDSQPQSVPASSQPWRVQPPAPVQPLLPPAPA
ncbi:lysine-rich arabinogalactan protein 19-like [Portunus trituberculatus]|uniref:lysine-rich arabinogalactan protein 19-like n=1 Tax=Portunus trituberculatus TaxID=210409 RepID=UPI001E1D1339|nr:lysine-rich arabinogalactan protein 19-like [Portunus trituberculatus]